MDRLDSLSADSDVCSGRCLRGARHWAVAASYGVGVGEIVNSRVTAEEHTQWYNFD